MNDTHLQHHITLLQYLRQLLQALAEAEQIPEEHRDFLERYDELIANLQQGDEDRYLGQELVSQVFQRYPQIAHQVPRDLLWFFGGECLHFMPDEEIAGYQLLEERRYQALEQGEAFDWDAEVRLLFMPAAGQGVN
ncbi:MAG: dehydrogenase [Gammaproteobacteria bacterium]|nr:dehydrogenase [Gammaproteobacteria bacterium]